MVKIPFYGQFNVALQRRIHGTFKDWLVFFCGVLQCMPNFLCLIWLGEHVCKEAWMYMLAIGRKRLSRCKRSFGGKDGRSLPSYLDAAKSQNRNWFTNSQLWMPEDPWLDLLKSQHLSGVFLCTSTGRQGSQWPRRNMPALVFKLVVSESTFFVGS